MEPSDYHLFRSPQHYLTGRDFTDDEQLECHVTQFFSSKNEKFSEEGIMIFPPKSNR